MTIGIFKNGRADWFYKCTNIEVTESFMIKKIIEMSGKKCGLIVKQMKS